MTGYGDEITDAWNLPDASNLRADEIIERPAKDRHAASYAEVLVGIVDIMADHAGTRGGQREPAANPRVARLRAMPYAEYLRTWQWRAKREEKIAQAGTSCQRCFLTYRFLKANESLPLNVHHLTYVRLGDERMEDLAVLCRPCHALQHAEDDAAAMVEEAAE